MKKITIRLEDDLASKIEGKAAEIYMPVSVWIVQAIVEKLATKRMGRPPLPEEVKAQREQKKNQTRFLKQVEIEWSSQQGSLCPGSEQVWPKDRLSEFSPFPYGLCGLCRHTALGEEVEGGIRVAKHKDGVQTDADLERVDREVVKAHEKIEEKTQKRRERNGK